MTLPSAVELWATRDVPLNALHENPSNPRRISKEDFDRLVRNLERAPDMLRARPVIVREDGEIVGGHMRWRAAAQLGWSTIPAIYVDIDDATAREWAIRDNAGFGEWVEEQLAEIVAGMHADGLDAQLAGLTRDHAQRLLDLTGALGDTHEADNALVTPCDGPARSQLGEVYDLGPHRLVCGDATDPACVELAVAGERAAVCMTDPPYGVDYDPRWRLAWQLDEGAKTKRDRIDGDLRSDWTDAYKLVPSDVLYVWFASWYAALVQVGIEEAGFEIRDMIVWVKSHAPMSRGAYHWQHEPCWYAVRKGSTARWTGDRKQTTVWEATSPIAIYGMRPDEERTQHSTQKPLDLYERAIKNHTRAGELIFDPFAGAGTAMIAAERLGRRAAMIELDPRWCDLIRDRYERRHT